MTYNQKL